METEPDLGQAPVRRGGAARAAIPTTAPAATRPARASATTAAYGFELPRVLMALGLVLGLIFLLRWGMKGLFAGGIPGSAGGSRAMQVLSRATLAPRQQLLLLRVGRRLIVVGDSGGQMTALSEITDADEVAALVGQIQGEKQTAASKSFGGLLTRVRRGFDNDSREDAAEDGGSLTVVGADCRTGPSLASLRHRDPDSDRAGDEGEDASVAGARGEIRDLMEKVRLVAHQFKET